MLCLTNEVFLNARRCNLPRRCIGILWSDIMGYCEEHEKAGENEQTTMLNLSNEIILLQNKVFLNKTTPVVEMTPTPVVEMTPIPVVEMTPTPVVEMKPTPVVEMTPAPVVEMTPAPVVEMKPTPVVEMKPTPVVEMKPTPVVEMTPAQRKLFKKNKLERDFLNKLSIEDEIPEKDEIEKENEFIKKNLFERELVKKNKWQCSEDQSFNMWSFYVKNPKCFDICTLSVWGILCVYDEDEINAIISLVIGQKGLHFKQWTSYWNVGSIMYNNKNMTIDIALLKTDNGRNIKFNAMKEFILARIDWNAKKYIQQKNEI
jgi:hypothetical protein